MEVGKYVSSNRSKKLSTRFKGERTFYEVTHDPSKAESNSLLSVRVPKVEKLLLVPGSLALTFDLDIVLDPAEPGNTVNTYPVNNLAANIISQIAIKISSSPVFNLEYAYLYNT